MSRYDTRYEFVEHIINRHIGQTEELINMYNLLLDQNVNPDVMKKATEGLGNASARCIEVRQLLIEDDVEYTRLEGLLADVEAKVDNIWNRYR